MSKRILVCIFIFCLVSTVGFASSDLYSSVELAVGPRLLETDGILTFAGGFEADFKVGNNVLPNWGFYGLCGVALDPGLKTFHDFLTLPCVGRFKLGLGGHFKYERFSIGLETTLVLSNVMDSYMFGGDIKILPKYIFLAVENEPFGYAISFPVSFEIDNDGMGFFFGIALSMEIGKGISKL